MIGKAGVWGGGAASGVAAISVVAMAGAWLALAPRHPPPPQALAPSSLAPKAALLPAPLGPRADIARVLPNGDVVVAGRTEPGAKVTLLDDGKPLMELQADPETGEFVFLPPRLPPGDHNLSLRGAGDGGGELENAVMAFAIAPPAGKPVVAVETPKPVPVALQPQAQTEAAVPRNNLATIAKGDTLWRLSRERLGRGSLYQAIVQANSDKVRNPNLIYPGQNLAIPEQR